MERLGNHYKKTGISIHALRTWGLLFLAAGIIGRGVIQNHILGINGMDTQQILDVMGSSETAMNYATLAIALQALETCAAPIFAILLVEGFLHTSDFIKYFTRVLGVTLLTEIPYNLCMGTGILDFSTRNPMFALVLGLLLMFFYQRHAAKGIKNLFIKILVTIAALLWVKMLSIDYGTPMIVIIVTLWVSRNKGLYRNFIGASAAMACCILNPYFLASPMSFLAVHMCNWEQTEENRAVNYLSYPGLLLLCFAVGKFLL